MTNKNVGSRNRRIPVSTKNQEIAVKNSVPSNNGFRPHGGYRGVKGHPPSPYSWDKSYDYHNDVDEEVAIWLEDAQPSPQYAIQTSKLQTNSGESPLFVNRLLAPTRLEQNSSVEEYYAKGYHQRNGHSTGRKTRPSSGKQLYYRPQGKHEYLSATSRSHSGSDASLDSLSSAKYGRPTRTTLLRARQRCNSAPLSTSQTRMDMKKQIEDSCARRSSTATPRVTDLLHPDRSQRESVYGFLIGARYNRAHCLDARSAEDFGVYMPRNNPLGCFIVDDKKLQRQGSDGVPDTPPETKASVSKPWKKHQSDERPIISKGFYDISSVTVSCDVTVTVKKVSIMAQKCDDDENNYDVIDSCGIDCDVIDEISDNEILDGDSPVSQSDVEEESRDITTASQKQAFSDNKRSGVRRPGSAASSTARGRSVPLMQHIINLDDGLNISGKSASNKVQATRKSTSRPTSALPPPSPRKPRLIRPASAPKSSRNGGPRVSASQKDPPFVLIEGKSMSTNRGNNLNSSSRGCIGQQRRYQGSRPVSANQVLIPSQPIISPYSEQPSANMAGMAEPDSARAVGSRRLDVSPRDPSPRGLQPQPSRSNALRPKSSRQAHRFVPEAYSAPPEQLDISMDEEEDEDIMVNGGNSMGARVESKEFDRVMEEIKAHQQQQLPEPQPEMVRSQILSEAISENGGDDSGEIADSAVSRGQLRKRSSSRVRFADEVADIQKGIDEVSLHDAPTAPQTGGQGDSDVLFFVTEQEKYDSESMADASQHQTKQSEGETHEDPRDMPEVEGGHVTGNGSNDASVQDQEHMSK